MAKILWIFYFSKIIEFIDTVIMMLKKNFRQVTFLHVYHHVSVFSIWWLVIFSAPGGDCKISFFFFLKFFDFLILKKKKKTRFHFS